MSIKKPTEKEALERLLQASMKLFSPKQENKEKGASGTQQK